MKQPMGSISSRVPRWFWQFALITLVLCALALLLAWSRPSPKAPAVHLLSSATYWEPASYDEGRLQATAVGAAGTQQVLPADAGTRQISLPFAELRSKALAYRVLAWSLTLDSGLPSSPDAERLKPSESDKPVTGVLFTQVLVGGDFFVNGIWVASIPETTPTKRRIWMRPFLLPLPPKLLHADGRANVLTIVQADYGAYVRMWPPMIGGLDQLNNIYGALLPVSGELIGALGPLIVICGLLLASAWRASPNDRYFAWAGIGCALWSLQLLIVLWPEMPSSWYAAARLLTFTTNALLIPVLAQLVYGFLGRAASPLHRVLVIGLSSIGPLSYALSGNTASVWLDHWWVSALLVYCVFLVLLLAQHAWRARDGNAATFVVIIFCSILTGVHDQAIWTGLLAHLTPTTSHWTFALLLSQPLVMGHLILPAQLIANLYELLRQYRQYAQGIFNANTDLQQALTKQATELAASHEHRRRLIKAEAAQLERERIYQDIHDGIGSRLVSTLFAIRRGHASCQEVESSLQSCIGDLRSVISTQRNSYEDIQSAVFEYCITLEAQLQGTDLELLYEVSNAPPLMLLPLVHLNVFRILQEAVANAIKHSGATQLFIKLVQSERHIALTVRDNGRGIPGPVQPQASTPYAGHGLAGFAARAKAIGGLCFMQPANPGTQLDLIVPLVLAKPDLSFTPPAPWIESQPMVLQ